MVSRFEYHARESLMGKRRQRRKEQLRNRAVALAAGLLLVGVCGVSSALAVTEGSDGLDVTDVPQDAASLRRRAFPALFLPEDRRALAGGCRGWERCRLEGDREPGCQSPSRPIWGSGDG